LLAHRIHEEETVHYPLYDTALKVRARQTEMGRVVIKPG
jgi:hypothetical protein